MGFGDHNTTTRWGAAARLLIGALPLACCVFGLLCADFGTTGKPRLYAFVTYLCLSFLYTPVNIPFCAMLPFLTSDSAERTTLSAVRICWAPLAPPSSPWLRCHGRHARQNQQQGFLYTAVIFGVLAAFSCGELSQRRRKDHPYRGAHDPETRTDWICAPIVRGGSSPAISF